MDSHDPNLKITEEKAPGGGTSLRLEHPIKALGTKGEAPK